MTVTVLNDNEAPDLTVANAVRSLHENTNTSSRIRIANLNITDDALGTNIPTLAGSDSTSFQIDSNILYLKAGTKLDFETKPKLNVTVQLSDLTLSPNPIEQVALTVNILDDTEPPVAANDSTTTNRGTAVTILVLANDTDPDSAFLKITALAQPASGSVVLNATATAVIYKPNSNFVGTDSFTYRATDSTDRSNLATVTVQVVNHAPVAVNDSARTNKATAVIISVLTNDTDSDGDKLSVTAMGGRKCIGGEKSNYSGACGSVGGERMSIERCDSPTKHSR